MIVQGKRLLITGVLNERSIAYAVVEAALREGAKLIVTNLEAQLHRTVAAVEGLRNYLPTYPGQIESVQSMDVNDPIQISRVRDWIVANWDGRLDGILHSVAYAPAGALGGNFLQTTWEDFALAIRTSTFSLKELTVGMLPLLKDHPSSVVTLTFGSGVAWKNYDWMGPCKAALEMTMRYLAFYLGPMQIRVNAVSAGPIKSLAARGIRDFNQIAEPWAKVAPLGWCTEDPSGVANEVVYLFSDKSSHVTGSIRHVDGGVHAVGTLAHLG